MKERRGGIRSRCCCCTGDQSSTDVYATIAPKNMSPWLPSHLPHLLCSRSTNQEKNRKNAQKTVHYKTVLNHSLSSCSNCLRCPQVHREMKDRWKECHDASERACLLACFSLFCLFICSAFLFSLYFWGFIANFLKYLDWRSSTRGMSQIWLEIKRGK
jgi:hypothetical protein